MAFTDSVFCGRDKFAGFNPSATLKHNFKEQTTSFTIKLNPKCKLRREIPKQNTFSPIQVQQRNLRRVESFKFRNSCPRKYPIRQRRSIIIGDLPNDY